MHILISFEVKPTETQAVGSMDTAMHSKSSYITLLQPLQPRQSYGMLYKHSLTKAAVSKDNTTGIIKGLSSTARL